MADAKSRLQEALQEKYNEAPTYRVDAEEGPSHQKTFYRCRLFPGAGARHRPGAARKKRRNSGPPPPPWQGLANSDR